MRHAAGKDISVAAVEILRIEIRRCRLPALITQVLQLRCDGPEALLVGNGHEEFRPQPPDRRRRAREYPNGVAVVDLQPVELVEPQVVDRFLGRLWSVLRQRGAANSFADVALA